MRYDMPNYWAINTDIWILGTPQTYLDFAKNIITHKEPFRILAGDAGGMDVTILPPAIEVSSDFLVFHERLVCRDHRFNMELVVGGSRKGFEFLADFFYRSAQEHVGDIDDHFHIDDASELLLMPSVFLNIRGPLDDIECHLAELAPDDTMDLVSDIDWRDPKSESYEPIMGYDSLYGRLPIKTTTS